MSYAEAEATPASTPVEAPGGTRTAPATPSDGRGAAATAARRGDSSDCFAQSEGARTYAAANFISLIASLFDTHPPTRLVA